MKKLVEIAKFSKNVSALADFYEKLLGAAPIARSEDMAIFMLGDTKLFLHHHYEQEEGQLPPEDHIAFEVEDVDAACKELAEQGLKIEVEPQDYYWGRSAYLRDPDGQLIELNSPADESSSS